MSILGPTKGWKQRDELTVAALRHALKKYPANTIVRIFTHVDGDDIQDFKITEVHDAFNPYVALECNIKTMK